MAWNGKRTICEVLRESMDLCGDFSEKIAQSEGQTNIYEAADLVQSLMYRLEEATLMAKKMDGKLRKYKAQYDEGWWAEKGEQTEIGG